MPSLLQEVNPVRKAGSWPRFKVEFIRAARKPSLSSTFPARVSRSNINSQITIYQAKIRCLSRQVVAKRGMCESFFTLPYAAAFPFRTGFPRLSTISSKYEDEFRCRKVNRPSTGFQQCLSIEPDLNSPVQRWPPCLLGSD